MLIRRALAEAVRPKVSYEIDVAALDAATTTYVESTVTEAIDDLDDLSDTDF